MPSQVTISQATAEMRSGRLSPLDLLESCLERIRRFESQVHAWVLVDQEGARAEARRLASAAAQSNWRGPLHGIPIGIKDIVDVAGWPTRAGSPLRHGHQAESDAPLVARLRAAGAIILGKTVTTEFASFDPSPTRNPWNPDRTPGGSSSGSAAAVAVGMCLGAIGSQTGGSITRPASYCGVAGCKPTLGRVSTTGMVPFSFHLDHPGPIARCVADLALLLDTVSGYDPADPVSVDAPPTSSLAACGRSQPPIIGLVEEYFLERASAASRAATLKAVSALRAGGARVVAVRLPASFCDVELLHRRVMAVDAAEYHRPCFTANRDQYGPNLSKLLDEGLATSAVDYSRALAHQLRFRRDMLAVLQGVDCLLTPATETSAPGVETTGDPRFNSPWSYSGLPTVSIPCGLTDEPMPVALQLIGPPFAEAALLGVAAWCERQLAFDAIPPLLRP